MTKEEKLELISKAIDAGFKVDLNFYSGGTKEQAEEKIKQLTPFYSKPYYFDAHNGHRWFKAEEEDDIEVTVFLGE